MLRTEEARIQEQVRLDALSSASARNEMGQFATPPALARDIAQFVKTLWDKREDRLHFLEPAVGSGSFYSALLQTFPADSWELATGIEKDPKFANAAKALWGDFGLTVCEADFTQLVPPTTDSERANLIVTNPPYVRHHHLGGAAKKRLKADVNLRLGLDISGLAGLYCYFLLLSDPWLATDGLSVWLIPTEFMEVNYGSSLRRYLTEQVSLLHVHTFDRSDVQFDDALVSSAIVVFQKKAPTNEHEVTLSYGNCLTNPKVTTRVLASKLAKVRKWTNLVTASEPRDDRQAGPTLSSLFQVKRGLATGDNNFFILPRSEAREKGIPDRYLKPILPSPRYLKTTVIESELDGFPVLSDQEVLIDCDLPEERIQQLYPDFWAYLEKGKADEVNKGYLVSKRKRWYQQENRSPAPFLCTYMGRDRGEGTNKPFRFIWNKSQAKATNVYLLLYPTGVLAQALTQNASLYPVIFNLLQNIDVADLIGEGRTYGGGLHKMEPSELGRVPAEKFLRVIGEHEGLLSKQS